MLGNVHRIVPKTQNLLKISALSLAIMSLVGCDEDFKDCQGFWDNAIGRSECNVTANSQPAQQALSADVKKAFGADPNKEDTDGDGLSDTFEITKGYPYLKPDNKDTDGNGVEDAKDDTDKDGLTNLEEMQVNTSPINPDTDGDGLNDKAELQTYKTNPLVADTDKDTIIDGREIANGSDPLIADADKFVTSSDTHALFNEDGTTQKLTVAIAGKGDLASKVEVKGWSDFKTPFQVGKSYDISLNDADKVNMQDATITLPYDPNDPAAANPSDLKIYTISPTTGFYEALPTTVDTVNHTMTAKTTHFSPYFIGNTQIFFPYVKAIPQTCPLISDPNAIPVDVALVIDSSGSMLDNDPQNLRIAAAKSFITNMKASDRAAVIDFDSGVIVRQDLTSEKTALSSALSKIDAAGGTNIGAGVGSAYSVLTTQSDASHTRVVILLTDGDGSYDTNLSNQLKAQNIRVFTIGLTGQVDEALLKAISSVTNGGYKQINDASGLVGVFGQFATVFGDTGVDFDKDGLTDCQEIQGISALNYNQNYPRLDSSLIFTKYDNPDTDGDGIPDGVEVGAVTASTIFDGVGDKNIFKATIFSNPEKVDTDNDTIDDYAELEIGSSPFNKDTDGDGITDNIEVSNGNDPEDINDPISRSPKTYKSRFLDVFGQAHNLAKAGFDTTIDFSAGVIGYGEMDSFAKFLGATSGNFIPSCGAIDAVNSYFDGQRGDTIATSLSVAGASSGGAQCLSAAGIPFFGAGVPLVIASTGIDVAAASAKQVKIVTRLLSEVPLTQKNVNKAYQKLVDLNIADIVPHEIMAKALKDSDAGTYANLEKAGLSQKEIVEAFAGISNKWHYTRAIGKAGEDAVEAVYKIRDTDKKLMITINGRNRIPDGINFTDKKVSEIKNVQSQGYTRQLRDDVDYARSENFKVDLYINKSKTQLTKPLLEAIAKGEITLKYIPNT